jgi:hypothetical protein
MIGLRCTERCERVSSSGVMPLGYLPALQISTRSSKIASETEPPAIE